MLRIGTGLEEVPIPMFSAEVVPVRERDGLTAPLKVGSVVDLVSNLNRLVYQQV